METEIQQFARSLVAKGYKLYKYSYTSRSATGYNIQVKGYRWSISKPTDRDILGFDLTDLSLSYVMEVEYIGQDLSQTIEKA